MGPDMIMNNFDTQLSGVAVITRSSHVEDSVLIWLEAKSPSQQNAKQLQLRNS